MLIYTYVMQNEPAWRSLCTDEIMGCTTEEYPIDSRLRQGIFLVYEVFKTGPGTHPASHSRGTGGFPSPSIK